MGAEAAEQATNGAAAPQAPAPVSNVALWNRIEAEQAAKGGESAPAEAEAPPAAVEKPKPAEKAAKAKDGEVDPADDAEGEVHPGERAKFREWKRNQVAGVNKFRDAELAKVEQARQALAKEEAGFANIRKAAAALESGDPDGLAVALGRKDWNELNDELLNHTASPTYKRLKELERRDAERAENEKRAQDQARQQQAQRQQHEKIQAHMRGMAEELAEHEDPLLAEACAEFPQLTELMFGEQRSHWKAEGEELDAATAASKSLSSLYANARKIVDLCEKHAEASPLAKRLKGVQAPKQPGGDRGARNPVRQADAKASAKTVSHTRAAEAAAPRELSPRELRDKYAAKMTESMAEDEKTKR